MMSGNENTNALIGLILLTVSACLELLCLFLVRILTHIKQGGGHILTIRMWLHMSAALEQIVFIVFNIKYHFIPTDFSIQAPCVVLRFLSVVTSTLTNSWIFVISSVYLMMTIKPATSLTFHSHLLPNCFTLTWTCFSCLVYLLLPFVLYERYQVRYVHSCWESNIETIHIFMTYGIELFPIVLAFIFFSCARCRIPLKRDDCQLQSLNHQSENYFNTEVDITFTINHYLILSAFITMYYILLLFKFLLEENGSDLVIMSLQSGKGVITSVMTCFVSNDIISMFRQNKYSTKRVRNSYLSRGNKTNGQTGTPELEMYTFITEIG